MKILAIDSSALTATAALSEDGVLRAEITQNTRLNHSVTLMPMVDELLRMAGWHISDIDRFAVANGPGSFTGLRIGIGTVKGLAQGTEKPCVGVSTLKALAYNLPFASMPVVPIMDARRGEVYAGIYQWENDRFVSLSPDAALPLTELCSKLSGNALFVGDAVPVYQEKIQEILGEKAHFAPISASLPRASGVIAASMGEPEISYHHLAPVYLRLSQAEREYQERMKES